MLLSCHGWHGRIGEVHGIDQISRRLATPIWPDRATRGGGISAGMQCYVASKQTSCRLSLKAKKHHASTLYILLPVSLSS